MTPRRYGPLAYLPITRRPKLAWPDGARVALWVNPNIEFFGLDDVMPGNQNERVPREHAKIPNVRNWAVRDYGNRVGIWRIMEVLTRHGIRASAALNSEVCDHHPEIIEEAGRLGWELIGHNQTNALRLTEMDETAERDAVRATIDRIEAASGKEVPKVQYTVGEEVKITDGAFASLTGRIDEIDPDRGKLKVSVSIFGRFTPVELEYWQVQRLTE